METFTLHASDGVPVQGYAWPVAEPRAVIHIAHGMGEHARRYDAVANALNEQGYFVVANDHRGHGNTDAGSLGDMGADGWNRVLADAYELNQYARAQAPDRPLVLLGHSMGAMLAQLYITRYGASIDALVLSGSPGFSAPGVMRLISRAIIGFEAWRLPDGRSSDVLQNLLFGNSNKPFDGPDASGFEWLSRDPDEVAKYVEDPQCGFVVAARSVRDLFRGAALAQSKGCIAKIPKDLPMYVFAGTEDPVNGQQKNIERMVDRYRKAGVSNVELRWYAGGRHEMFNETNRAEVISDLLNWLDANTPAINVQQAESA